MARLETRTEPMVLNGSSPSLHAWSDAADCHPDGEDVVDCEPVLGYLHRGMEKIAENRTNIMPYVSRWTMQRECSTKPSLLTLGKAG